MNNYLTTFIRSILAGICIGLGGAIFVRLGGIAGAVMFAFGLLSVIHFKLPLYTGTAGFISVRKFDPTKLKLYRWHYDEVWRMTVILIGNICGCYLLSLMFDGSLSGNSIIQSRIDAGYLHCLLNSIGCGLIMTLIVKGGRDKNLLLILFGIPLFILLGFYHSIADAFYASISDFEIVKKYFLYYIIIVVGNFIGCNIPRLLKYEI